MPLTKLLNKIIPELSSTAVKGDCGRVGVIGGSFEYTGAPYFAAQASLLCGADLVSVFCSPDAGQVIKSYSPELIVHPLLTTDPDQVSYSADQIMKFFNRLDAIVIGPGLGRNYATSKTVTILLQAALLDNIPLVIDADGLYIVTQDLLKPSPEFILNQNCVLTPNPKEYLRLLTALGLQDGEESCRDISKKLNGATIIRKGPTDLVCSSDKRVALSYPGSKRRIGGQGDILAGCIATFLAWGNIQKAELGYPISLLATFGGSRIQRAAAYAAFSEKNRGMTTSHVLDHIGPEFTRLFEDSTNGR